MSTKPLCIMIVLQAVIDQAIALSSVSTSGSDSSDSEHHPIDDESFLKFPDFCYYFGDLIGVEVQGSLYRAAFDYFDGPNYGGGEGEFTVALMRQVVQRVVIFEDPELEDPAGALYKQILSSSFLENISFRSNGISRWVVLELKPWSFF